MSGNDFITGLFIYFAGVRYFVEIAYCGTGYAGWQRQPNALSIQEVIEGHLSTILGLKTNITGCGRTDAGVHASMYFFHFDTVKEIDTGSILYKMNRLTPLSIAFKDIYQTKDDAHARFDATKRAYKYYIHFNKDPFKPNLSYQYPWSDKTNWNMVQRAALLLMEYNAFFPFSKTRSDVKNYNCQLFESSWEVKFDSAVYHISANRFLRGMVRLVVGMCLEVGLGKITLMDVQNALDRQSRLPRSWSVPADGLYLDEITY